MSTNDRFYLSYDIKNTLKSHFWRKQRYVMVSICTKRCYGRHFVSRKSISHLWFTDFIAWRYFTSDATSYDNDDANYIVN